MSRRAAAILSSFLVLFVEPWSVLVPSQARAPVPAPPRFEDAQRMAKLQSAFTGIDEVFRAFAARQRVPGAAWGIVIDGQLAHAGAAGLADVAGKTPVTADTVFRIASMTKSFTAMAILKLRDEGRLGLDDPAERYVPELKALSYPTSDAPRITIRHLLTHAAGFPEDNPWGDQQLGATDDQFSRMLRSGIPFSNPPGLAYEYSNYGFAILGRVVSRVSGQPYRDYVTAAILKPLGMTSTTLQPSVVSAPRLAHGYRWEDERWKDEPLLPDGAFGAMGGMLTSMTDLSRYVGALMDAFPPRSSPDRGPVQRSSLREMQQLHRFDSASAVRDANAGSLAMTASGYGYGLRISQTCAFGHMVAHGGGLPGFGSLMRWLPEYGVGLIAAGNLTYTGWGGPFAAALDLLQKTGGLQPRAAQPSPALVEARSAVSRLVTGWDDQAADQIAAVNLYQDLSKDRRRAALDDLHKTVGACPAAPAGFEHVENALRGQWVMKCERGALRVAITLAPTVPPRVQAWTTRVVRPDEPARSAACVP